MTTSATRDPIFRDDVMYNVEPFFRDDSPKGVTSFEAWRARRPDFHFRDCDAGNYTLLGSAISFGNIALVAHILQAMDKSELNLNWGRGERVLGCVPRLARHFKTQIKKVIICAKMVMKAGVDVNQVDFFWGEPRARPLDILIDFASKNRWKAGIRLMKVYIKAGAQCFPDSKDLQKRLNEPYFLNAQHRIKKEKEKEVEICLANEHQSVPASQLPSEVLNMIIEKLNDVNDLVK